MSDTPASLPAQEAFPPASIQAFLRFCAGEWLSLRSQFSLGAGTTDAPSTDAASTEAPSTDGANSSDLSSDGETWHTSQRAELMVGYLNPDQDGEPGGLQVGTKDAPQHSTRVVFGSDGQFSSISDADTGSARPADQGSWTLWPDGSLELVMRSETGETREKIWFTKPNLRLRSTVETYADGAPGRASFSSEIRRVTRPS